MKAYPIVSTYVICQLFFNWWKMCNPSYAPHARIHMKMLSTTLLLFLNEKE